MKKERYKIYKKSEVSSERYMMMLFVFTGALTICVILGLISLLNLVDGDRSWATIFFVFSLLSLVFAFWIRRETVEKKTMTSNEFFEEDMDLIVGLRYRLLWGGAFAALPALILAYAMISDPKSIDSLVVWIFSILVMLATGSITCIYQLKRKTILFGYLFALTYFLNLPFGPLFAISTLRQTRKISHHFKN